jgi:hypothetical protein
VYLVASLKCSYTDGRVQSEVTIDSWMLSYLDRLDRGRGSRSLALFLFLFESFDFWGFCTVHYYVLSVWMKYPPFCKSQG